MKGGIGFVDGLGLIFITLKLVGVIDWTWGWVLSPLIAWLVLALLIAAGENGR
jgi:hypothetical protein